MKGQGQGDKLQSQHCIRAIKLIELNEKAYEDNINGGGIPGISHEVQTFKGHIQGHLNTKQTNKKK